MTCRTIVVVASVLSVCTAAGSPATCADPAVFQVRFLTTVHDADGAAAGDTNGDGYGDFLILSPTWSNGQVDEGAAFLHLGSIAGLSPEPALRLEGQTAGTRLGSGAVAAGDVDGDGLDDVFVMASTAGSYLEARLYRGAASGLETRDSWRISARRVLAAGDLNGDGFDDVIVQPRAYFGSAAGLSTLAAWSPASIGDPALGPWPAGDFDGDGFADLVCGTDSATSPWIAYLYRGSSGGPGRSPASLLARVPAYPTGSTYELGAVGDVHGDGLGDLAIIGRAAGGSVDGPHLLAGSGSGLPRYPSQRAIPADVAVGDIDGDGRDDVAALTDSAVGTLARVHPGSSTGIAPTPAWVSREAVLSIGPAGDVDGDGASNLFATARDPSTGKTSVLVWGPVCPAAIVDSSGPGTKASGTWSIGAGLEPWGPDSRWARRASTASTVPTYRFETTLARGTWAVYEWHPVFSNRTRSARHAIEHSGGTTTIPVDQSVDGGRWNLLGEFSFAGRAAVTIRAEDTQRSTVADAVRFVCRLPGLPRAVIDSVPPPDAPVSSRLCFSGRGEGPADIAAYEWTIDGDPETRRTEASFCEDPPFGSLLGPGPHEAVLRVEDAFGRWSEPASASFSLVGLSEVVVDGGTAAVPGTEGLWHESEATGSYAGSSRWAKSPTAAIKPARLFTARLVAGQRYEVFEWHSIWATRTKAALHRIQHAGGVAEVLVDQSVRGGQWNSLGTFAFGEEGKVTIVAQDMALSTNADAVRFAPR